MFGLRGLGFQTWASLRERAEIQAVVSLRLTLSRVGLELICARCAAGKMCFSLARPGAPLKQTPRSEEQRFKRKDSSENDAAKEATQDA